MDEKERGPLSGIAKVNVDIFQGNSLIFPVIEWDDLSLCVQPEGANEEAEFNELHCFSRIGRTTAQKLAWKLGLVFSQPQRSALSDSFERHKHI